MLRHSRYLVACCGAAFGLASFFIGLEVSATTASLDRGSATINRTLKSDRLPVAPGKSRNAVNGPVEIKAPRMPASRPELLEGCEPMVSAIGQSPLSRIPGRCLS